MKDVKRFAVAPATDEQIQAWAEGYGTAPACREGIVILSLINRILDDSGLLSDLRTRRASMVSPDAALREEIARYFELGAGISSSDAHAETLRRYGEWVRAVRPVADFEPGCGYPDPLGTPRTSTPIDGCGICDAIPSSPGPHHAQACDSWAPPMRTPK